MAGISESPTTQMWSEKEFIFPALTLDSRLNMTEYDPAQIQDQPQTLKLDPLKRVNQKVVVLSPTDH